MPKILKFDLPKFKILAFRAVCESNSHLDDIHFINNCVVNIFFCWIVFVVLGPNLDNGPRRMNPHKYLLFKPSPAQVLVYLASGCNDLPPNGALLLYISADGQTVPPSKHPEDGKLYFFSSKFRTVGTFYKRFL